MDYTYAEEQKFRMAQRQAATAGSDCGCGGPRLSIPPVPAGIGPGGPGPGSGPGLFQHGPGPGPSVTVVINGGRIFPAITQAYRVPFYPGLSIYQALAATGVVRFNWNGQIISVSGIPIGANISYQLQLNGRIIPPSLLSFPVQRNDAVTLQLIYNPFPREDESEGQ
ncbi:hypothetical protein [Paenibacillus sp. sgz302251]|uniref:hypothetical protein n=1 Tax=Paenibacillus sp. sgz302251 TaxID=3414493 RepID=UPI003C7D8255